MVLVSSANILELHAHIRLKELILIKRIDLDIACASSAKSAIDAPGIGICEVQANGVGEQYPVFTATPFWLTRLSKISESTRLGSSAYCSAH